MPDRVIRDELLTSDRWTGLADNAYRLAYLACLLTVDTLGNMEAGDSKLIRLWRDFGLETRDKISATITALDQAELAKPYEHENKRYLHVPRFRQHRRYIGRLCPLSPWTTDDDKQYLTKNSHSASIVSTLSAHKVIPVRTPSAPQGVGVGLGVGVGIGIGKGVGVGVPVSPVATDEEVRAMRAAERLPQTPIDKISQTQKPKPNGQDAPIAAQGTPAPKPSKPTAQANSLRDFLGAIPK